MRVDRRKFIATTGVLAATPAIAAAGSQAHAGTQEKLHTFWCTAAAMAEGATS